MNKIISSEYFEYRSNNYLNRLYTLEKVKYINTKKHKTLIKTKEVHKLDNDIMISIININNAIYSNDLIVKIKLDDKRGYEFKVHLYRLGIGTMVKEEPVFIGDVDKHCTFESNKECVIGIAIESINTNIMIKDVYGHIIAISGFIRW